MVKAGLDAVSGWHLSKPLFFVCAPAARSCSVGLHCLALAPRLTHLSRSSLDSARLGLSLVSGCWSSSVSLPMVFTTGIIMTTGTVTEFLRYALSFTDIILTTWQGLLLFPCYL